MIKRATAGILCAALLFGLCGCAGMFTKEYSRVTDYVDESSADSDGKNLVKNYYSLKQTMLQMVNERKETGRIAFGDYDGDISSDLKSACWELRTQNALCAYCVESINYELSHIVTYEEAEISIKYSRSAEEMEQVVKVSYSTQIRDHLLTDMEQLKSRSVIFVTNSALDEDGVTELIKQIYMDEPLCVPRIPAVAVQMYSGLGLQRLFEVSFDYGTSLTAIKDQKERLDRQVDVLTEEALADTPAQTALNAARAILESCTYSPASGASNTYDALVSGDGDSLAIALGYKALCARLGIDCTVVTGLLDRSDHWWNIIELEGEHYHVDLTRCMQASLAEGFLRSDMDMWGSYRWDTGAYMECRGELTYDEVVSAEK